MNELSSTRRPGARPGAWAEATGRSLPPPTAARGLLPRRFTLARLGAGAIGLGAVALLAALPAKAAYTPSAEGASVAVTTDNAFATSAALDAMRRGGNAFDGAVAAALTLGVTNPVASGLGGGGFALVYVKKEQKVIALDFREVAPEKLNVEKLLARDRASLIGVPGEPAGLAWLHDHYGKRTLAEDALPAADLAARGFSLGRHMADLLPKVKDHVVVSDELARMFYPGGTALSYRATVKRTELSRTILRFGAEGARPFYEGDIAAKIVASAKAAGSTLEASDLAKYKVRERAPLSRAFGSRTVYAMPAPSAGGLMLLETLSMYGADKSSPLVGMGFGSSQYLHMVAEAMRGALADRVRHAGDPDADPAVNAAFESALDPAQIAARRARIDPKKTRPAPEFKTHEAGTSHFVVADAEGNVVSLTTTVNGPFGSRVVAGDSGEILNDQLGDFSAPKDIAGFGVVGLGSNRPRPGARPVSSMTPTIVLEDGKPILALGGSGGMRIATNVTQVTLARLLFDLEPTACISSPRVAINGKNNEIVLEPEIAADVRSGLQARGEVVQDERFLGTAVQLVAWDRKGSDVRIYAATDPRKAGFAAAQ